ncbi:MAG: GAF domain-containing protein, partial [Chloroflexi bacterium]
AFVASVADTDADGCLVGLLEPPDGGEPQEVHFAGVWGRDGSAPFPAGSRFPLTASLLPLDFLMERRVVSEIVEAPLLSPEQIAYLQRSGVQALVNIPLRAGNRTIGFTAVYRRRTGPFSEASLRLYEALSGQVSVALERVWLLEVARRQAEEETALRALSDRLARAMDMEALLQSAAEGLEQALRAGGVYIELGPAPLDTDLPGNGRGRNER